MGWFGGDKPSRVVVGAGTRRRERYPTSTLTCVLGEVVDVSQSGLRVRGTGRVPAKVGQVVHIAVSTERQRVSCSVRVVWTKWKLRSYEMGLEFVETSKGARIAIEQLGRFGFIAAPQESASPEPPPSPPPTARVEVEDLYAILGVGASASDEEIRRAYRAIARTCHPDVCGSPESAAKFALLSKAYTVLKDAELRKRYDDMLRKARAA